MLLRKLAHRVQTAVDFRLVHQRLLNPRAQQAAAHRRAGFVQQPEQAPLAASPADGFRQFQIPSRVAVKQHRFAALINAQAGHVLQGVLLRLGQIPHQRARGTRARLVLVAETQRRQVIEREMAAERFRCVRQLKPRARLLRSILHLPLQARAQLHLVIADDFHRGNERHLVRERRFRLGDFMHIKLARGHISERQPRAVGDKADA